MGSEKIGINIDTKEICTGYPIVHGFLFVYTHTQ